MRLAAVTLAALVVASSALAAETFVIDPAHSYVGFGVKHMVISTVVSMLDLGASGSPVWPAGCVVQDEWQTKHSSYSLTGVGSEGPR